MPGRRRRSKPRTFKFASSASDGGLHVPPGLTVNDFANAEKPHARMKKGEKLTTHQQVTMLAKSEPIKEELSWFEKKEEDFDRELNSHSEESNDEETEPRPAETISNVSSDSTSHIGEYPLDLWFTLSDYIYPEDICRFARLCKAAHSVIQGARFWRNLYKRFYDDSILLPETLQKNNIERVHGLRGRVIRSLYFAYPPFVNLCKLNEGFTDEAHKLEGWKCVMVWYQHLKNNLWKFNFKLVRSGERFSSRTLRTESIDLLNGYNNVYNNPEDGCCVLQVSCHNFIQVPIVMGLVLNKVYVSVSQGMRYHKLRLIFDSHMKTVKNGCITGTPIILDPVVNLRIFHWWEPLYPQVT